MAEIVKNNVMRACTVMLIVLLDCTLGQITLERHKQVRELCLRDSLLWTDTLPRSVIRCVLECRRTDRCYAITVSTQTSLCSYYDWRLDSEYPLIMGCTASADSDDYIIIPDCGMPVEEGYVFGTPTSNYYQGVVNVSCANGYFCEPDKINLICLANGSWEKPTGCAKPGDYEIGCYKDTNDRALAHQMNPEASAMTPAVCLKYCINKRYAYASNQYGVNCFCGNDNDYGKYGTANNCDMPCSGDGSQLCGGYWANMVYNISSCII